MVEAKITKMQDIQIPIYDLSGGSLIVHSIAELIEALKEQDITCPMKVSIHLDVKHDDGCGMDEYSAYIWPIEGGYKSYESMKRYFFFGDLDKAWVYPNLVEMIYDFGTIE